MTPRRLHGSGVTDVCLLRGGRCEALAVVRPDRRGYPILLELASEADAAR